VSELSPVPLGPPAPPDEERPDRLRLLRRLAFLVVFGLALHIALPSVVATLSQAPRLQRFKWPWLAAMVLCEVASLVAAWALARVAVPRLRWRTAAVAQLAGNAISRLVPGGAAAGSAVTFGIWEGAGVDPAAAVSGLLATSVVSTITLLTLPVVGVVIASVAVPVPRSLAAIAALGAVMACGLVALAAWLVASDAASSAAARIVGAISVRIDRLRRRPPAFDGDAFCRRIGDFRTHLGRRWREAVACAAGNWLFDYLALVIALVAIGANPEPSLVLVAYTVASVLAMIPITPGGLGFVEAGLVSTLVVAGVPSADAVLATLGYRLVSYWLPVLTGLVVYAAEKRSGHAAA
jgi:uncharacterized membrane protein YbhN (UPF0104 family)